MTEELFQWSEICGNLRTQTNQYAKYNVEEMLEVVILEHTHASC